MPEEDHFLELVTAVPMVRAVLDRAPSLRLDDWWLTAGVLFQWLFADLPVPVEIRKRGARCAAATA